MKRRNFIQTSLAATTGLALTKPLSAASTPLSINAKKRLAIVGTGHRGTGFWGKPVLDNFGDMIEFVGMCDINPGRLETAKQFMGAKCPTFSDFDKMVKDTKPDMVIVTTVDATHDLFIVKALEAGCDVITEKPMTTDEDKCQSILDAERRTGRKVIVGFNYRHNPHMKKLRELLMQNRVGKITSVDFHWYLNVYHGADYFRRWHAYKAKGGSLWVHKASHHFDLLNWWLDSDPVEVTAFGQLENYGKNGETIQVPKYKGGHGGGDSRMHDLIFRNPTNENPLKIMAGTRDGAFSSLIGIAARKSIELKRAIKISELTDLKPMAIRPT